MQFENFDMKVREAAENHHPAYNEQAWARMEKLLNKHLPVEKKKRRRFLFWWMLPLMLGGTALMIFKPWQREKKSVAVVTLSAEKPILPETVKAGKTTERKNAPETTTARATNNEKITSSKINNEVIDEVVIGRKPYQLEVLDYINKNNSAVKKPANAKKRNIASLAKLAEKNKFGTDKKHEIIPELGKTTILPDTTIESVADNMSKVSPANIAQPTTTQVQIAVNPEGEDEVKQDLTQMAVVNKKDSAVTDIASKQETEQAEPKSEIKKEKKGSSSSFFAGLSTGVDMSFISGNKAGTVKPVAGIGIGYTFRNRFTVRTGFYAGRKIYSADGNSYKGTPAFYQYYPYLESVDANCKIYEIPLLFSYHLGKNARQNWMLTAGLSSLLMKEESYHYYYKYTATGALYDRKWTIRDENNHFFSVFTLSAGYNRSFGKRFRLLTEPYLKLPLNGIGAGSIKLNSGGVLFTLGYRIF